MGVLCVLQLSVAGPGTLRETTPRLTRRAGVDVESLVVIVCKSFGPSGPARARLAATIKPGGRQRGGDGGRRRATEEGEEMKEDHKHWKGSEEDSKRHRG